MGIGDWGLANGYLDLDFLLKCNKIKVAGWTKEEICEALDFYREG